MKLKKVAASVFVLLMGCTVISGCAPRTDENSTEFSEASSSYFSSVTSSVDEQTNQTYAVPSKEELMDPQFLNLCKKIDESGYQAGMAYIASVDSQATEGEMRSCLESSAYAELYAFLRDASLIDADGTELYAVVTTKKDCSASVYPAEINENGTYDVHTENALYEGKGKDCFLLRCNRSELHSNVSILLQTGDDSFEVFPMLSGKDGRLDAMRVYDFSIYVNEDGNETDNVGNDRLLSDDETNIRIATDLLCETDEVSYYLGLGMSIQYTGEHEVIDGRECWIFALGTEHDGQFVRELYYGVCDNLIYSYDTVSDAWSVLGAG